MFVEKVSVNLLFTSQKVVQTNKSDIMKVIGYDERGCPLWKEDDYEVIKEKITPKQEVEPKKEVKFKPKSTKVKFKKK